LGCDDGSATEVKEESGARNESEGNARIVSERRSRETRSRRGGRGGREVRVTIRVLVRGVRRSRGE
jgi:hypothetical protein